MATELIRAYLAEEERRTRRRTGGSLSEGGRRDKLTTRQLAAELGVSERTARRYRQENRVPARRAREFDELRQKSKDAEIQRYRRRIRSRGLRSLTVRVSESQYDAGAHSPSVALDGIAGSGDADTPGMAEVFDLLEAEDPDLEGADAALGDALAQSYGMNGGSSQRWIRVDSLTFTLR